MAEKHKPDPKIQPLTRTQLLATLGVSAFVLWLIAKLWLQFGNVSLLPLKWTATALLWGVSLALIIIILSSLVYRLWPNYRRSADFYLEFVLKSLLWSDLIWVALLPGLSEELLFRGVLLPAFGLNVTAVVLSSLCFGVLHLNGSQQWSYVAWATVVGLLLGYSVLITGNLLVPILAHIITNLVSSCFWKLKHSE